MFIFVSYKFLVVAVFLNVPPFAVVFALPIDSQTPNRYRTMERGHSGRKDLSVPRYGRKLFIPSKFLI